MEDVVSKSDELTSLLLQAEKGDREAADRLYRLVEDDLRKMARLRRDRLTPNDSQDTTGLVDEAFVRLIYERSTDWDLPDARRKFFSYIACVLHDILVDSIRRAQAERRGGGKSPQPLDAVGEAPRQDEFDSFDLLFDIADGLKIYEQFAREDAIIFRLQYVLGCGTEDIAAVMDRSRSTIDRSLARTRAWLQHHLKDYANDS